MSEPKKILIIDDDKVVRSVINKALGDKYVVEAAVDGEEGLEKAMALKPQVILLDVEMPRKNGYEVCDILKRSEQTRHIPVVFLSGHGSLRERLLGYEVGGDDYLTKPFSAEIIQAKVKILVEMQDDQIALASKAKSAEQTALEAITGSSELGRALRFVETTYSLTTYKELAQRLFELLQGLELNACVFFETGEDPITFTSSLNCASPLEQELMGMLHSTQRFYDFGCRTQINYPVVALLIKNMPLQHREKYGRIKDMLPFVLAATDEKVARLNTEHALRKQAANLSRSLDAVKTTLTDITNQMQDNQQGSSEILRALLDKMDLNLPKMGLEEDQEQFIVQSIDTAFATTRDSIEKTASLRTSLEDVVKLINYLTDAQRKIVDTVLFQKVPQNEPSNSLSDIELF